MEQKKKHNRNIYIVLAVVLCLAGVFFVKDAVRAVEEMAYPRTYAALVQQYAAEYGVDENKVYAIVPFPVSWTVKMKKKQKETQDILSYHTQAAGCSDKARAKASGGRQPIEECGRTGL